MRKARFAPRNLLLELFKQGLMAVDGSTAVRSWMRDHPPEHDFFLVALGKAAHAMTSGALEAAAGRLRAGLMVTHHGLSGRTVQTDPRIVSLEAGHPLPDSWSLVAGDALLAFLKDAPPDAEFLFLVSGGTSSVVEVPVKGVDLETLRQLNAWLLGSGLPISAVNRVRVALSRIKGGRLTRYLDGRRTVLLLISDVPGDVPSDIGSGLLLSPDQRPLPEIPTRFADLPFQKPVPVESDVEAHVIASNTLAREAAAAGARAIGLTVRVHDRLPDMDAVACGTAMADALLKGAPGVYVWGGETTVKLPKLPGKGGRNQQLALSAARTLADHAGIWLLAAGTDGNDGATGDAGALVDCGTVRRGEEGSFDAADCLRRADAGAFLEASGDLVHTGPTGTNVMDLMLGYKAEPPARGQGHVERT